MSATVVDVDVVVVGGGHNGLVAGCYLARAGRRVVVLERHDRLGGMTLSAPLIDAAPGHMVNPGAYENVYLRAGGVVEDLDLARFGYREVDSAGWAWLGESGESLLFQRDVDATARDIARFSSADGRAYRELIEVALKALEIQGRYAAGQPGRPGIRFIASALRSLATDRGLRSALGAFITGTAVDAITATFESEQVRGAFASIATILGAPTAEGSALAMLGTSSLHYKGAARPIGGMGGLVTALEHCLVHHGGEARTGATVTSITGPGRAAGVELADGSAITARQGVVTAIPPQRVPDLTGEALSRPVAQRLRHAPANAGGVATFTVNLALSGQLALPNHQPSRGDMDLRKPALFTGTLDGVLDACADAARGELPTAPAWWCTIFTAMDPSQAPEGQDTVQLYGPVPMRREGLANRDARRLRRRQRAARRHASRPRAPADHHHRQRRPPGHAARLPGARRGSTARRSRLSSRVRARTIAAEALLRREGPERPERPAPHPPPITSGCLVPRRPPHQTSARRAISARTAAGASRDSERILAACSGGRTAPLERPPVCTSPGSGENQQQDRAAPIGPPPAASQPVNHTHAPMYSPPARRSSPRRALLRLT